MYISIKSNHVRTEMLVEYKCFSTLTNLYIMTKSEFIKKKCIHKNNKKMETNILLAQIDLKANIFKVQSSLEEIKLKHPSRFDLIESMEQTERDLNYVFKVMFEMENELRIQHNRIMSLERLNVELKTEIKINKF